jgi:hypothetical protein
MPGTAHRARELFALRDELESKLRETDAELRSLRSQYMTEARVWGISLERFRHETTQKAVA